STLAGAIVSKKLNIKLAHIEAGLRSRDMTMPEEVNRIVTDAISDYLFTTCKDADDNLLQEGHSRKKIFFVGNLMIDSLIENISKNKSDILKKLKLKSNEYCIITLHRPSNVDDSNNLKKYLELVNSIQKKITVVFPIHPRTLKMLKTYQLDEYIKTFKNFVLTEPLGYIDFIKLLLECKFILTDSGGIQEEASYLKIPCLTLRKNTERPITITEGTNTLVGDNFKLINSIIKQILNNNYKKSKNIKYWDGKAALRISNILKKLL
ncbi:MAG TPA: UDP-N-acetylglucosamine 2-epimerase (non-hydrolyzing), partial [bacterium]|nr:UDP-N-acetylglucosamine 2-epimerase (non-hydrolyzing) [bacterium]